MAPNGFAHHGKEEEKSKAAPPPSNVLLYGIILTVVGLASRPFFGMLVGWAETDEQKRLFYLLSDIVGIVGVIVGLSIVAIAFARKHLARKTGGS